MTTIFFNGKSLGDCLKPVASGVPPDVEGVRPAARNQRTNLLRRTNSPAPIRFPCLFLRAERPTPRLARGSPPRLARQTRLVFRPKVAIVADIQKQLKLFFIRLRRNS